MSKKLVLSRETLLSLGERESEAVAGGLPTTTIRLTMRTCGSCVAGCPSNAATRCISYQIEC